MCFMHYQNVNKDKIKRGYRYNHISLNKPLRPVLL